MFFLLPKETKHLWELSRGAEILKSLLYYVPPQLLCVSVFSSKESSRETSYFYICVPVLFVNNLISGRSVAFLLKEPT